MTREERILDRRKVLMAIGCEDESLIDALDALESHLVGGLRFVVLKNPYSGLSWIKLVSEDGTEIYYPNGRKNRWSRLSWDLEEDAESVFGCRTVDRLLQMMLLDFGRIVSEGLELYPSNSLKPISLGDVPPFETLEEMRMKLMLRGDI